MISMAEISSNQTLDQFSKAMMIRLWCLTADVIGTERFEAAFLMALRSSPYFPRISDIRRFAGLSCEVPVERRAKDSLGRIIHAIRSHMRAVAERQGWRADEQNYGWKLRLILGRNIEIRRSAEHPEGGVMREPDAPGPTFDETTEAAFHKLGFGLRESGLEVISRHPSLNPLPANADSSEASFRTKHAKNIEALWIEAFKACEE